MVRVLTWCVAGLLAMGVHVAPAQTLRIALQDDPDSLDPALNWSFVGRHVLQSLCDKLVDVDAKGAIVPMLATSWTWSEAGRTLTLSLREGVTFHDGTRFDAEAVRFNLQRALTMRGSRRRAEIEAIDQIEVIDAATIRLHLKSPSVPLLAALSDRAGMMISPTAANADADFANHPICAGPYRFVDHRAQERLTLERFPAYWRPIPGAPERVVFRPIPDSTVRLLNLRAGQIDIMERLGPTDVVQTQSDPALSVIEAVGLGYYAVTFNMANGTGVNHAVSDQPAVREAFDRAIDRAALNEVAFGGHYIPGNQPVPPGSAFYDPSHPVAARDLPGARAALARAGLPAVTIELLVPTDPERQQVAQIMQSMLAEAGITLKIQSVELISLLDRARRGDFEAHLVGWSGRVDPDLNITPLLGCGAAGNDAHYCGQELEAALAEGRATDDVVARRAAYAKAAAVLLRDRPLVYLYHASWIFAVRRAVRGFVAYPDGIIRLDGVTVH